MGEGRKVRIIKNNHQIYNFLDHRRVLQRQSTIFYWRSMLLVFFLLSQPGSWDNSYPDVFVVVVVSIIIIVVVVVIAVEVFYLVDILKSHGLFLANGDLLLNFSRLHDQFDLHLDIHPVILERGLLEVFLQYIAHQLRSLINVIFQLLGFWQLIGQFVAFTRQDLLKN